MKHPNLRLAALLLGISLTAGLLSHGLSALAIGTSETIPREIPYHGVLYEDGDPVNGKLTMTFSVFDGVDATAALWSESHAVKVTRGRFSVELGASHTTTGWAAGADDLYVEVAVKTPDGETVTLPHRRRLVSAPAAILSTTANTGSLGPELRLTSTAKIGSSDDDAPIVVRDGDGHMLKIDGNQLESDTTLSLQKRSGMGVTAKGDLDVGSGDVYLYSTNGVGGLAFELLNNGDLRINPDGAFAETVFDSDFTRVDSFVGLEASTWRSSDQSHTLSSSVDAQSNFECPDDQLVVGGRFEGNYSGAKAVYALTCGAISIAVAVE